MLDEAGINVEYMNETELITLPESELEETL
jgi:hypothetical protein